MGACWSVHGIDSSSASSSRAARFRVAEVLGRFGLVVVLMELPLRFKGFFAVDRVGAYIRQEERCWRENRKKSHLPSCCCRGAETRWPLLFGGGRLTMRVHVMASGTSLYGLLH